MTNATESTEFQEPEGIVPGPLEPNGDNFLELWRDRIRVRSLTADDLPAIVAIDRANTGRNRREYIRHLVGEVLNRSGIRVSLVAETDRGAPVGFIMVRIDFGEFGRLEPEAVIDTIGVDPLFAQHGIGTALMSQLLVNLRGLQIEKVRTGVAWNDYNLLRFLEQRGFAPSQRLALRKRVPLETVKPEQA